MTAKDRYITLLAEHSETPQHELIVECLDAYGVMGTKDLTADQLEKFCKEKGLVE